MAFIKYGVNFARGVLLWAVGFVLWNVGKSQGSLVAQCDFERDFCNWTQDQPADGLWRRHAGRTPSSNSGTGPISASPDFGGEYYIYLEGNDFENEQTKVVEVNKTVVLLTPELSQVGCIAFLYMKYGQTVGFLRVGPYKNGLKGTSFWENSNQTDRTWHCGVIATQVRNSQIYFEATSGLNYRCDIAVDSVAIYSSPCDTDQTCLSYLNVFADTQSTSTPETPSGNDNVTQTVETDSDVESPTSPPTQDTTTVIASTEALKDNAFPTEFLFAIIVPVVVLIIAAVVAVIFYRHRLKKREEEIRRVQMSLNQQASEEYDLIDESAMSSHVSKPQHRPRVTSSDYDTTNPNDVMRRDPYHGLTGQSHHM